MRLLFDAVLVCILEAVHGRTWVCNLRRTQVWIFVFVALAGANASAEPLQPRDVPPLLRPWIGWVLKGHEFASCPFFVGEKDSSQCAWPGVLRLQANATGGTFSQTWQVNTQNWVDLPGDEMFWPQNVRVDQRAAVVLSEGGRPRIWLEPGSHRIEGEFFWDQIPETLATPSVTGLVDLYVETRAVALPTRDAEGRLWLKKRASEAAGEENRLEIIVHRQVLDEIPLQLNTRITLQVSGASREVLLGRALPEGFIPLALTTPLPARLEADGKLRVQVRPGSWSILLEARHHGPVQKLVRPVPDGPWSDTEVWVFAAQPSLRIVEIAGLEAVDPQQTLLPDEWRHFPAYVLKQDSQMQFIEKQRGNENPIPDRISLARRWWLDFDGRGFTVADSLSGVVSRSTRLEMQPTTALGRIALHGRNQLITRNGDSPQVGIEIPVGAIQVDADSRIETSQSRISAVGWDQDFQQVSGVLYLPPGWRLFHVHGADSVSNTWVQEWTLLDLFLVMVLAMAIFQLFGPLCSGLALATFVLTFTEPNAPRWAWVVLILFITLQRVVLRGRFLSILKAVHALTFLSVASLALFFSIQQARIALHPALERPHQAVRSAEPKGMLVQEAQPLLDAPAPAQSRRVRSKVESKLGSYLSSSYALPAGQVSTGPGLPNWEWTTVQMTWNGPVSRTQELHFFLLNPFVNALLAFLRIGSLFLLLAAVLGADFRGWIVRARGIMGASSAIGLTLGLLLMSAHAAQAARTPEASVPQAQEDLASDQHEKELDTQAFDAVPGLFDELRNRLLERPACFPNCTEIARLHWQATPTNFRAQFEVHAATASAVPFSLGLEDYTLKSVSIDGAEASAFRRGTVFWIPVQTGRHVLVIEGALPPRESIEIPFALKPHRVTAQVEGWQLHGLLKDGRVENALQLTRIRNAKSEEIFETSRLPAFVWIDREIVFDLKWSMHTRVSRATSLETPILLEIPLWPGEAVTSEQVRVREGRSFVQLAPGIHSIEWDSTLEMSEMLALQSANTDDWSEIWRLRVSPIWHVEAQGIPEIYQPQAQGVREWRPWPGEKLTLRITRPVAVSGRTVTIDRSVLRTTPGQRATEVSLNLTLRSSQGGPYTLKLPQGSELQRVVVDDVERPMQRSGEQVTLDLIPGTQTALLVWREPRGLRTVFTTSGVDLGIDSVNSEIEIEGLQSRWPLFLAGPRLGPAILFWPMLLVYTLLSFGLSRLHFVPLRFVHWLLLGVGLTQVYPLFAFVVIAWLVALGLRKRHPAPIAARYFNWMQFGLIVLTLFALGVLWAVIAKGLLGYPQMYIAGNGSSAWLLRWYHDRATAALPQAWLLSVPLMVYRCAMLVWALWLAYAMNQWLRWGWSCFSEGGAWRKGALKSTP